MENERNGLVAEIKELKQKCITYENKIGFFTIEIERLNGIILEKQEEAEESRMKLSDVNLQFRNLKELHLVSVSLVCFPLFHLFTFSARGCQNRGRASQIASRDQLLAAKN